MNWQDMEQRWQDAWQKAGIFEVNPDARPKKLITVAYPYPNSPQHLGHGRTYTIADIHARFWRMRGYNVLFPMGFHYTGTPILGMARRVADSDPDIMDGLENIYKVPPDAIQSFTDPLSIADYFSDEIEQGMKEMGYSVDWRRRFTTIHPAYKKFVAWQINSLRRKGLIKQGSHPVGWCPVDCNPVSQHDTLGDVEPEFTEYTMIKFRVRKRYSILAATLRPETIYGVTNMWVNPDVSYGMWRKGNETWVMTEECAHKLAHQGHTLRHYGDIPGQELVGTRVRSPTGRYIRVLPAKFVKPDTGTGIVMSVPAHAPFDYAALRVIDPEGKISSRPVIQVAGYGDDPAAQICQDLDITDNAALEKATETLYNKEFYSGVMRENCDRFSGMKVAECRDLVRHWLMTSKGARTLIELNDEVRCRCGAKCLVKILEEQWFLDYGDTSWKEKAHSCLDAMEITPPDLLGEFHNVVDWLRERACARQRGLGTRLPWDADWIVESLTDSTIYTAFYIIMKFVNNRSIDADKMDDAFFDYVFLGKGKPPTEASRVAREEFLYYYPVDARHSGRDLVPNHLTFFVMNHTALFENRHWPRRIVVNGSVLMDGKKMSKSMGNILPLRGAIREHGADPIRLGIAMSSELLQDADIRLESVSGMGAKLEKMITECTGDMDDMPYNETPEDVWMISRLYSTVKSVTHNMERMRMREALHDILYGLERDMQWYGRRLKALNREIPPQVTREMFGVRARLLAPFAPHAAEEMWRALGNTTLVSASAWPDIRHIDESAIHDEDYLASVLDDISNIVRVTGVKPGHIRVYAAQSHEIYNILLRCVEDGDADMRSVMARITNNENTRHLRTRPKEIATCLKDILSESSATRQARLIRDMDEEDLLAGRLHDMIRMEYDCSVTIHGKTPGDDPGRKARLARAYHPAIYIE